MVLSNLCAERDGRVWVRDQPLTGTKVTRSEIMIDSFNRVELQSYVDGISVGPFVDEILGIDTEVCVLFEGHYAVEPPSAATCLVEFKEPAVWIWSAHSHSPRALSFWPNGELASLNCVEIGTVKGEVARCRWEWGPSGSLRFAECAVGRPKTTPQANSQVRFDSQGRLEHVVLRGSFLDRVPPLSLPDGLWVLQSLEELFDLEVSERIRVPNASEAEDRILLEARKWLSAAAHLDLTQDFSTDFAKRLVETCDFDSILIDSLGGRRSWPRYVEGDERQLIDLAKAFLASRADRRAEVDHCIVDTMDCDLMARARDDRKGSMIFDKALENLVALDAPFLHDVYLELMRESPLLEFVRITAGSVEERTDKLMEIRGLRRRAAIYCAQGVGGAGPSNPMAKWARKKSMRNL